MDGSGKIVRTFEVHLLGDLVKSFDSRVNLIGQLLLVAFESTVITRFDCDK